MNRVMSFSMPYRKRPLHAWAVRMKLSNASSTSWTVVMVKVGPSIGAGSRFGLQHDADFGALLADPIYGWQSMYESLHVMLIL